MRGCTFVAVLHPKYSIACVCILCVGESDAQDVEQVVKDAKRKAKEDPLRAEGSVGVNTVFYKSYGIVPRRDPFYWALNANLNFILFNTVTVPLTAVVTAQYRRFTGLEKFSQPFNQLGLSPRYRWLTVHAGYRSMEFSEYTMSGTIFLGAGVEVKPQKSLISGSAFTGRFVKAVPRGGTDGIVISLPAYERWGSGGKLRAGTEKSWAEIIIMKFTDNLYSISMDTFPGITPQENQIIGIAGRHQIYDRLTGSSELDVSMFTNDLFQPEKKLERFTYINQIYKPRASSQVNYALNSTLDYNAGKAIFSIRYRRVGPDYKSLGTPFLTNDVEEISLNGSGALFRNNIQISAGVGVQRNNLDKVQALTARRLIGSLNVSYNISSRLNLNFGYSSFSSNTIPIRDIFSDSVKFVQLAQSANFSTNYSFGSEKINQSLQLSACLQETSGNKQEPAIFSTASIGYNMNFTQTGWGAFTSVIYNENYQRSIGRNLAYGPSFALSKQFFRNRVRAFISYSGQRIDSRNEPVAINTNATLGFSFTLDKSNSLKADAGYLSRKPLNTCASEFAESRINLGYRYNFQTRKKAKQPTQL
jgi:hypothetical protein